MIAEAIDTLITLGWALAAVAAVVLLAGTAVGAWAVRGLWRTVRARQAREARCTPVSRPQSPLRLPRGIEDAPRASQRPSRPAPSWAHADHHRKEAA
ncbi:hypothetical protein [Streptomyces sp. HC307]|uniref:hypothetical protein n=1 Tax=Streptomyces flavusporus TaxID=3385496 RepID=UPI00391731EB